MENVTNIINVTNSADVTNPITRQDEFLTLYPYANADMDDILYICPHDIDYRFECVRDSEGSVATDCDTCRERYWKGKAH